MADFGEPGTSGDISTEDRTTPLSAVGVGVAVLAVVLLGINLRLVFGSASSMLVEIRETYQLGSGSAALLTTGPVLCLGVFALAATRAIRRWTVPAVLTGCLVLVLIGTVLRGLPWWLALVGGTLIAGVGIAVANVLGPILIRLLFPDRIGLMTGLFTALISASAGIASGATPPLDTRFLHNWRVTLALWAVPAVLAVAAMALVAWRRRRLVPIATSPASAGPRWQSDVLRSPVAWAITGFMGLQSLLAYSMIAWLPTIYRDRGLTAENAGLLLTALSLSSIVTALTVPILAARLRSQSVLAVAAAGLSVAGLTGVVAGGVGGAVGWAILLGLGQGAQLSLALTLMNLRARTAATATSLSAMAQSVGYLVAATGPLLSGALHSATGSWTATLAALLVLMIPLSVCGLFAGRGSTPGDRAESARTA